jgi:hypothetical protein
MKMNFTPGKILFATLLMITSASCTKENDAISTFNTASKSTNAVHANVKTSLAIKGNPADLVKAVHSANAKYNSSSLAIMAGYQPDDHCVSVPGLGGMGYHWVNPSLVDATFDPLKPEVLLYARGPGGNLQLIGVEYIVINVGQPLPMFGDQPFQVGGSPLPIPHWSLHAWVYEPNPSGMFAPFNPNVTCP